MEDSQSARQVEYFKNEQWSPIEIPSLYKTFISRLSLPLLTFLSRDQSLGLGLVPVDDERVVMALKHAKGRTLDVGCGANNFIRSYKGEGTGVDVFAWDGCDDVIEDAAKLPFKAKSFDTVSFLACLNHIPNREAAVKEAHRVLSRDGQVLLTMIGPTWGRFIHWIRFRNDPDHQARHIDHDHEMLGMSQEQIFKILKSAGFRNVRRKRFVFGLNNLYIATK
jgi:SAM-dependent methyltransferase